MKRLDPALALTIFVATLTLYVRTLAPSLLADDSGEFQTIAYTLGMGHPTGYPVYILIAKLFTFLPVGDIAYRVNLLSAAAGALAISLLYLILRRLSVSYLPAALGAFILAGGSLFWKQAAIAEVYTSSVAFLALVFYSILSWKESDNPRWLFVAGLFGGMSLGIHTTVALSGIAILLFLVLSTHKRADWLYALIGVLTGVALFLGAFLLLDFIDSPAGYYNTVVRPSLSVWGMTPADFDSPFERLAFLYFPPQFRGQFFAVSQEVMQTRLKDFFIDASWNAVIALVGVVSLFIPRKGSASRWREAVLFLTAFATFLIFSATYDVYDYYVFSIPALLLLIVAMGLGFSAIGEALSIIPKVPHFVPVVLISLLIMADLWFSFPYVLSSWEDHTPPMLESYEMTSFLYPDILRFQAEKVVNEIEDNAIVFTDWSRVYDFYYIAHVIQGRTETDFHETHSQVDVTLLPESMLAYISANVDSRPIYFTERPSELMKLYDVERAGSGLFKINRR